MSRISVGVQVSCLVFCLVAHVAVGLKSSCDPSQVEKCQRPLKMLTQKDNFQLVPENADLKVVCGELQTALACYDDFVRDCVPESENQKTKMQLEKLLSGVRNFLKNVCDENSELYRDYEKHGKCMATVSDNAAGCTANLKTTLESQSQSTEDKAKRLEAVCCAIQRHLDCTKDVYMVKCGAGAARFIESSLKLMYGGLIEDQCNDEYGNPRCSNAFTVRPAAILFALAAIFWVWQLKLW